MINKRLFWISLLSLSSLLLTACDNYPYKTDIQETYDWNNQSGNKAICMIVGDVSLSMYPYTIKYMEGEDLPYDSGLKEAYFNRLENENFRYFTQLGFFTEEKEGETEGKPLYRYQLTDLGRKYFDGFRNQTNFCFGRVVVDSVNGTKDSINGIGGGTLRDVSITYHIENIPDWVKNSDAYARYRYPKEMTTGESLPGTHTYKVLRNDKLESIIGESRRFQWATRSDEKKD
ncbi:hypothetical protein RHO13_00145 [Orbus wheelerorum]|uniref:hypothetical protein n=1 Tax=Orbus wheelerorum TaxID=3074111 RepID=UPI00370DD751